MGILKKIKKTLKKVAKPAAGIGAVLLAANAMKNRKNLAGTEDGKGGIDTTRRALQAMTSNDAYNDDTMPGNLSRNMGMKPKKRNMYSPNDFGLGPYDGAKDGGRIGKKSGGSVKKSMGKALRGGGKVMR
mgnify:CR=1 FL=1